MFRSKILQKGHDDDVDDDIDDSRFPVHAYSDLSLANASSTATATAAQHRRPSKRVVVGVGLE